MNSWSRKTHILLNLFFCLLSQTHLYQKRKDEWTIWLTVRLCINYIEPQPPSQPLHFHCSKITSNTITLKWCAPHDTGGIHLAEYTISYRILERINVDGKGRGEIGGLFWRRKQHSLDPESLEFTITDLPGSTEIRNVVLRSTSESGLIGQASQELLSLKTNPPNRMQVLLQELDRANRSTARFIDTEIYHDKMLQRFEKFEYIKRIQDEIELLNRELRKEAGRKADRKRSLALVEGCVDIFINNSCLCTWLHFFSQ